MRKDTAEMILFLTIFAALAFCAGYLLRWYLVPDSVEVIRTIEHQIIIPYKYCYL